VILVLWVFITNETELSHVVLDSLHHLDLAKWIEHGLDVSFAHFDWNILVVQVVREFSANFSSFLDFKLKDTFA
jgi:hypothetical protein